MGMDLSLRRPAAAVIPARWRIGDWGDVSTWVEDFDETPKSDAERYVRIIRIAGAVRDMALMHRVGRDDVWVEDYAYSRSSSSVTKLGELGGVARIELFTHGRTVRAVTASSARKLLLGKVPKKDQKLAVQAALKLGGAPFWEDPDVCDAFAVANWARSEQGLPAVTFAEGA
jgi:Holliday junction resolvasome RuvABC endonuclease subunit